MTTDTTIQPVTLTQEERNDLRRRVLAGQQLTLDEARAVIDSLKHSQGVAMLAAAEKPKRGGSRRPAMSDEQLDADLDALL